MVFFSDSIIAERGKKQFWTFWAHLGLINLGRRPKTKQRNRNTDEPDKTSIQNCISAGEVELVYSRIATNNIGKTTLWFGRIRGQMYCGFLFGKKITDLIHSLSFLRKVLTIKSSTSPPPIYSLVAHIHTNTPHQTHAHDFISPFWIVTWRPRTPTTTNSARPASNEWLGSDHFQLKTFSILHQTPDNHQQWCCSLNNICNTCNITALQQLEQYFTLRNKLVYYCFQATELSSWYFSETVLHITDNYQKHSKQFQTIFAISNCFIALNQTPT